MTPPYQVYVDGSRDPSPSAVARLAAAIGGRYGLPTADIATRLAHGRFRVKANADRATAEQYVQDLESLGAICSVVDSKGAAVDLAALPPSSARSLPPPRPSPVGPRPMSGPLPPGSPRTPSMSLPSGLAAAASGGSADLGALGRDDGAMSLSSLDGDEEPLIEPTSLATASFGPPGTPARAAAAPASAPPPRAMSGPAGDVDMFAVPDDEAEMELALDVVAEKQQKASTVPPPIAASVARDSRPSLGPVAAPRSRAPGVPIGDRLRGWLADAKLRFGAGVIIAVLVGAIPALLVGSIRQNAEFAEIDARLNDQQNAVTTPDEYQALDRTRAFALDRKYAERRDIAITALLIWAVVGAAIGYIWFRRLPWDRFARAG